MKYAIVYYQPVKRTGELLKNQTNLPMRKKELALGVTVLIVGIKTARDKDEQ